MSQPKDAAAVDRRHLLQIASAAVAAPIVEGATGIWGRPLAHARPAATGDDLRAAFHNPPSSAAPGVYWYWLGGAVTAEGITADLEAMSANGISYAMLFTIGKSGDPPLVTPPADALTPHWWDLVRHAVSEAKRVGMTLGLNICDGWATASGPWITPELSMQHVVWTETVVEKETASPLVLSRPQAKLDYYRDIRTVAFPFPKVWDQTSVSEGARLATDMPASDLPRLSDASNDQPVIDTDQAGHIDFTFARPFTLRSVTVHTPPTPGYSNGVQRAANSLEVFASDDGAAFRRIGALEYPRHGWQTPLTTLTHALPETTARVFRFVYTPDEPGPYFEDYDFGQYVRLKLLSLILSSTPRIHQIEGKSGEVWAISRRTTARDVPDSACVRPGDIVDLSGRMKSDGSLDWRPPAGRWKVLRIGYTTTGAKNSAAGGAQGLECDKFNPDAARLQFDSWFGRALDRVGPELAGHVLHGVHVDSWEAGSQNWSPRFAQGFERLRGYDLLPYLPVMTGTPVESADVSERVLLDVRRTIADLVETEFFAVVSQMAHARGCIFTAEVPNPTFPADGFQHARYVDLPMGEFWLRTPRNDKPTDIKDAVNGARIYGKPVAGAESFTEGLMDWTEQPWTFKALGDHNWCEGINRLILHVYAAQPWPDHGADARVPGETLSGIGTFFGRTQTWWKPARAWFDYLRRSQALLQQGRAVADVAYFTGENLPARSLLPHQLQPALPAGYAYDSINRDALLNLARVEGGALVLQSGARYRVLVLPPSPLLTPEIAERVRTFVQAGLTVVGPKPECSPSLQDRAHADAIVGRVAGEVWGDLNGTTITERRFGQGRIVWGQPLESVLHSLLAPDVAFASRTPGARVTVQWTHRSGDGWDLYFLSNQSDAAVEIEASLRVSGRVPELWRPDTGEVVTLAAWRPAGDRTVLSVKLDPRGSVFVVFRRSSVGVDPVVAEVPQGLELRSSNGGVIALASEPGAWSLRTQSGRTLAVRAGVKPIDVALDRPWTVAFADRLPASKTLALDRLAHWGDQDDPDIRFYSGTAIYRTRFDAPGVGGQRLFLDLGDVADLASVRLNGRDLGVLWKPPFMIDITDAVEHGANTLEIAVTNTWRNRLIGDYGKPEGGRTTFVVPWLRKDKPWLPGGPGTALSPAGLLGPVRLRGKAVVVLG